MTIIPNVSNKPRLLIVGAGGYGQSVAESVLIADQFKLVGFLDDIAFTSSSLICNFPILGPATAFEKYAQFASHAVVAIGNNAIRQKLFTELQSVGFELANIIHPMASVSPRAKLGSGVTVMAGAVIGTDAVLANGVIINSGAVVDHHAQVHEFAHLGVNACMAASSVLGALALMQAGSAIGYGINILPKKILKPGDEF